MRPLLFSVAIVVLDELEATACLTTVESLLRISKSDAKRFELEVWTASEALRDRLETELDSRCRVRATPPAAAACRDRERMRAEMEAEVLFSRKRLCALIHPGCVVLAAPSKIVARAASASSSSSSKPLLHIWETHESISPFDSAWALALPPPPPPAGPSPVGPLVGCRAPELCVADTRHLDSLALERVRRRIQEVVRFATRTAAADDTRSAHPRDCLRMVLCRETRAIGRRALVVDEAGGVRASLLLGPRGRVALCVHGDLRAEAIRAWAGVCENAPSSAAQVLGRQALAGLPEIFEKVSKNQKRLPPTLSRLAKTHARTQDRALLRAIHLVILGIVVSFAMLLHRDAIRPSGYEFESTCAWT